MTPHTIKALTELCDAIGTLAAAVSLQIGVQTASEILSAAHNLKTSLKDELATAIKNETESKIP